MFPRIWVVSADRTPPKKSVTTPNCARLGRGLVEEKSHAKIPGRKMNRVGVLKVWCLEQCLGRQGRQSLYRCQGEACLEATWTHRHCDLVPVFVPSSGGLGRTGDLCYHWAAVTESSKQNRCQAAKRQAPFSFSKSCKPRFFLCSSSYA